MTGKIKMVLLAITLCLGIGLRSMGAVQAAVYSEACPFCGTMVSRGSFTRVLSADFMQVCDIEKDCNIYWVVYGEYTTVTCQTPSRAYSKFMWKIISQAHPFCMSNDILPDVR